MQKGNDIKGIFLANFPNVVWIEDLNARLV